MSHRPMFLRNRHRASPPPLQPRPWFSKLGPLCWYRDEWITLNLTLGPVLLARVHRGRYGVMLALGGRVRRWSIYGHPTVVDPWWTASFGEPGLER